MKRFVGVAISPGIAIALPIALKRSEARPELRVIGAGEVETEYARFLDAVAATKGELLALRKKTGEEIGESEAEIFDAHILVLDDPLLHYEVQNRLEAELHNVETVLAAVISQLSRKFAGMKDSVMRERAADVADVGERLIRNLMGQATEALVVEEPSIVVATEISPSTAALIDSDMVLGFVSETGGTTSHTAILARALGIPAVVVTSGSIAEILASRTIIVDGILGVVIASPDGATLDAYEARSQVILNRELVLRNRTGLDAVTLDGTRVDVAANLEIPSEIAVARAHGAQGVGLFRTEFLFMNRSVLPDEEEQYRHYRVVAEAFPKHTVVIRTIDIGGDKFLSDTAIPHAVNPYLGLRAIRLSLQQPALFQAQLRAILRAGAHGRVCVLFPMIACLEEVSAALAVLADCAHQLGVSPDVVDVGVMMETPGAVMVADHLARHLDYFSIGTNDLIQYSMAAERGNEQLAYLERPMNPSILKLISLVVRAGKDGEIGVGVCGEMAGDLIMTPLLVGLGVRQLSLNPRRIPLVKEFVRRVSVAECEAVVAEVASCAYTSDIANIMRERFGPRIGELEESRTSA